MMIRGPVPMFVRSYDAEFRSVEGNLTGSGHCVHTNEHGDGEGTCRHSYLVFELGEGRSAFCNLEDSYAICISSDT